MTQHQTIALDAMGGDFGPAVTIPAAANALKKMKKGRFLIFGDEKIINPILDDYPNLKKYSDVTHTDIAVSSTDKPSTALRNGKGSSMRLAIEAVRDGVADGVVSAGNTGALMVMSKLLLKSLPGISRPAIASVMPTQTGKTVMLDLGTDITKGTVDVVVTDGFTGNIALKTAEGVGKLTKEFLTDAFKSSPLSMLGYLLCMRSIKKMKDNNTLNYFSNRLLLA